MKVQSINLTSQYQRNNSIKRQTTPVYNVAPEVQQSFGGINFKFLRGLFASKHAEKAVSVATGGSKVFQSDEFFLKKIEELGLKKKDGFFVLSPEGTILHEQECGDYHISDKTNKIITGNIILTSENDNLPIHFVGTFFEEGVEKIFHCNRNDKEISVVSLPEKTDKLVKKGQLLYSEIQKQVQNDIHGYAINKAMQTGEPVFINASDIGPILELNYMEKFLAGIGAKLKKVSYDFKAIEQKPVAKP